MSVIRYEESFFSQLYSDLLDAKTETFRQPIFDLGPDDRHQWLACFDGDEDRCRQALAGWFVDHLFVANGLAHAYQYDSDDVGGKMQVERPPEWQSLPARPIEKLAYDLGRLDYNLSTNGGTRFLGRRDEERLGDLMRALQATIAGRAIDTVGRTGN